jgi:hypothetical protein
LISSPASLVTQVFGAITASLVASSVLVFADSADAKHGDKIKEKVKELKSKIKSSDVSI